MEQGLEEANGIVSKLESQINESNVMNVKEMEKQREILGRAVGEQEREREEGDAKRRELLDRIRELEETSRLQEQNNLSLRGDYQRL